MGNSPSIGQTEHSILDTDDAIIIVLGTNKEERVDNKEGVRMEISKFNCPTNRGASDG